MTTCIIAHSTRPSTRISREQAFTIGASPSLLTLHLHIIIYNQVLLSSQIRSVEVEVLSLVSFGAILIVRKILSISLGAITFFYIQT
jgi:hypothetical protein